VRARAPDHPGSWEHPSRRRRPVQPARDRTPPVGCRT